MESTIIYAILLEKPCDVHELVKKFKDEYGVDVEKSALNSLLYTYRNKKIVSCDDSKRPIWSLVDPKPDIFKNIINKIHNKY